MNMNAFPSGLESFFQIVKFVHVPPSWCTPYKRGFYFISSVALRSGYYFTGEACESARKELVLYCTVLSGHLWVALGGGSECKLAGSEYSSHRLVWCCCYKNGLSWSHALKGVCIDCSQDDSLAGVYKGKSPQLARPPVLIRKSQPEKSQHYKPPEE